MSEGSAWRGSYAMTVLIFSHADDAHALAVMEALRGYGGAEVELLDLSDLPQRLAVSMYYESGQRRFLLRSLQDNRMLNLAQVRAVWWRRPQAFALPAAMIDSEYRRFALSELTTALQGLYQSMDALWVNAPVNDATAGHKPFQLAIAQRIGLEIPPTLMTNDPDAAVAFWQHHEGQIVYKQFAARPDSWRETRRLRPEETALADAVQWAPVIFQRYVEAEADIRVTAVGDTLFAAAADVRHAAYPVDIRLNPDVTYHAHTLPEPVSMLLRRLMRELRLCYGAIDLRLTPDGRYVFLEINPAGQYLYIEQQTGQQISAALAGLLASP
jgi:glutathione synthase/RimK-type ligase-like ATP-grasp enzyme